MISKEEEEITMVAELEMLAEENYNFAKYLKALGISDDNITNIANGCSLQSALEVV